jgi:hypothetical protein
VKNISSVDRLRSLPAVFRGSDLTVRFKWTSKTASQYVYLWRQRGLVDRLGGHSDVFVNLLKDPPDWEGALKEAMPSAVIIGIEALRHAGWVTQIQPRPTVAVNATQSVFSVDRFDVTPRSANWFDLVRSGIQRTGGLARLNPAWALADLLKSGDWGECGLGPDDMDWDLVALLSKELFEASSTLGIPANLFEEFLPATDP